LGIAQVLSYEGQSGSIMEDLYDPRVKDFYPYTIEGKVIDWRPLFEELIKDKSPLEVKVSRFINTFAEIVKDISLKVDTEKVGLTGGVFQNKPLTEKVSEILKPLKEVLIHQKVPAEDGGLTLGQVMFDNIKL
jgi:hydrogenase maturation protein HypF